MDPLTIEKRLLFKNDAKFFKRVRKSYKELKPKVIPGEETKKLFKICQ